VALGRREHALQQLAVLLLDMSMGGELVAGDVDAVDERVADALEVLDAEDAGAAGGRHAPLDALAGEGGLEEGGEVAFEASDLAAQVAAGAKIEVFAYFEARSFAAVAYGAGTQEVKGGSTFDARSQDIEFHRVILAPFAEHATDYP
jgi:hypothetical protein